ncbi:MAG: 7-carboxy-7-deazaguanine synthase [Abditibacteriota bacterium]|nr:7-carboxy-7-deazaguanine synthase [Abditibacteriota bacterium]
MSSRILISEIFGPTIQGEGSLIGRPTVFVRTGACDFRCSWCDTLYAVLPEYKAAWTPHSAAEILDKVLLLTNGQPILITLSGGNPALQPLEALLDLGHAHGCTFALETQGSVPKSWFARLDHLVLSPKPPSSGMTTDWATLRQCLDMARVTELQTAAQSTLCGPQTVIKIVVFDEDDYAFARQAHRQFPDVPFVLQSGNSAPAQPHNDWSGGGDDSLAAMSSQRIEWLLEQVTRDGWFDATILPQLHVLLWGNKRGV